MKRGHLTGSPVARRQGYGGGKVEFRLIVTSVWCIADLGCKGAAKIYSGEA
jgi:hypothetical protein